MATKVTETTETPVGLFDTFKEFTEEKHIDRTTLVNVIEDSFRSVLQKQYGTDENYSFIVNPDNGDFEIYRSRIVVKDEDLQDENTEIGRAHV